MTSEMINSKIEELRQLEAKVNALQKELEAVKDSLKSELDSRQVDSIDTGSHRIFYHMYEKSSVDTAKLKTAGLYDDYSKKSTIIQFKITDIKNA